MERKTYFIIWPERRAVSAETIFSWYGDAVFNNEIDDGEVDAEDTDDMAKALDHAGIITLGETK